MSDARIAIHGRTYWDAEVEVPLEAISGGKGKVDARVVTRLGGFAFNAARALAGQGGVRVVTVAPAEELKRLKAGLPKGVALDALPMKAPLPVSVILNPARECRILRDPSEPDARAWSLARVPKAALNARLHIVGRIPLKYVAALLARAHRRGGRVAWVGGHSISPDLERACDLMCVNAREAARLVGASGAPSTMAVALAERAEAPDAVRVVTGAGGAATTVAFREGGAVRVIASAPPQAKRIVTLLGVGDAFATHFMAACVAHGVEAGLEAGQRAAGRFLERGRE